MTWCACCFDNTADSAVVDTGLKPLHSSTTLLQRACTVVPTLVLAANADYIAVTVHCMHTWRTAQVPFCSTF
jgi:hypothetical protein